VNVFEPNGIKWILNEAFSISIARFKLFVTLVAIIQVPAIILSLYFSGLTEQENRYDLILQIISYLTAFFAMTVSSSLIISAIGQHYAYNKVTLSFCFKRTWWRIISISLWAVLLTIPLFAITYLANNAFNNQENTLYMLSIIIVMVTFIPFLIYTSFYTQTVIIEGFNLLNGIKRSANLIHQKILKVFAAIILIGLLAIGLSVIVNIPFALLELSEFENNVNIGNPNSSILFYSILFLRNFVDSVIVFPILITAGTLLYFDIRSDKENYDINKLFDDIHISSHNLKLQQ
jgi:hypothetical protein|tara:strand:- start:1082 stop:1951 length:870 start_codon:yes stop_codon:yes gene_type:complete